MTLSSKEVLHLMEEMERLKRDVQHLKSNVDRLLTESSTGTENFDIFSHLRHVAD